MEFNSTYSSAGTRPGRRGRDSHPSEKEVGMRVMVIVPGNKDSEARVLPSKELLTEMGKFNEELVKAGVMLMGEGLHSTSKGVRVKFSGEKRTVIDGPGSQQICPRMRIIVSG